MGDAAGEQAACGGCRGSQAGWIECVNKQAKPVNEVVMKLGDLIVKEAIVPELQSVQREGAIRELVEALAKAGVFSAGDVSRIMKGLMERERQGSTGFGKGVAVPHAKDAVLKKSVAAVGRSVGGIDFSALDQAPVYTVVLLLSPPERPELHLEAMEHIFRHLQQDMFRRFLRQAGTREEIVDLITEVDQAPAGH